MISGIGSDRVVMFSHYRVSITGTFGRIESLDGVVMGR